jgi:uncharacterized membrane protein YgaE (UPF0421/DUF939 family)
MAVLRRRIGRGLADTGRRALARVRTPGSGRDLVVQPVKATLAASVAWLLADLAGPAAAFYAPMAALLMVQSTVYRSVYTAVRQLVAVLLGILIAMAVGRLFVVSPVSVALVVFPALLIGQWRRLGDRGADVAVYAVIILTFGRSTENGYLLAAVVDIVIGIVLGTVVNALLLPPLYLRPAETAVAALGRSVSGLLRLLGEALRDGAYPEAAERVADQERLVAGALRDARYSAKLGSESSWWNPGRRRRIRRRIATMRPVAASLSDVARHSQRLVRMLPGPDDDEVRPPPEPIAEPLADLFDSVAELVDKRAAAPSAAEHRDGQDRRTWDRATRLHAELTGQVGRGSFPDPAAWAATGSMLLELRRAMDALSRPDAAD